MRSKLKLSTIWGRPTATRTLVIGDLIVDRYLWTESDGVNTAPNGSPPAGDEVRPGGAAAVATLTASLGGKIAVAGTIGNDSAGQTLLHLLSEARVEHSLVTVSDDCSTGIVERTFSGSINDGSARLSSVACSRNPHSTPAAREHLLNAVLAEIAKYDALLIPDHGHDAWSDDMLLRLVVAAAAENLLICVDPQRTQDYSQYRGASLVKTSRGRAEFLLGKPIITCEDALEAGHELCRRWCFMMAIITLGREGMALVEAAGDQFIIPTTSLEVFEKSGAREVSLATIGLCLAAGTSGEDAIRLANLAAGLEIQRVGIEPISHGELHEVTRMHERKGGKRARSGRHRDERLGVSKLVSKRKLLEAMCNHRQLAHHILLVVATFERLDETVVGVLKGATRIADVVVAGIASDGPDDDLIAFSSESRARMLATVPWVDYVVELHNRKLKRFIRSLRPDVLITPGSYVDLQIKSFIESYGGELRACWPDNG